MTANDRAWFPTSPGQSATVVALAVMLMINMTVLVLMVSGELSLARSASSFDAGGAGGAGSAVADEYEPTQVQADDAKRESHARPHARPSDPIVPAGQGVAYRPSAPQPVVVAPPVVHRPTPTVVPVRALEPTPAEPDDDEPLTFFGLPIE